MLILPSHKISGVLLDIVHEAKQELVLVSPYVNLTYWKQLATALTAGSPTQPKGTIATYASNTEVVQLGETV